MGFIRDRNNYPDIQIAPYTDEATMAQYPNAVYTNGCFIVSSRSKQIIYEVDVYASMEAFEQGGEPIALAFRREINAQTGINYDEVILGNQQLVGGVLMLLNSIEQQIRSGAGNKVEIIEDEEL